MKEIIKQAKNPIKNRIIPPDIIEKYSKKLQSLESDVEKILQEEKNERELAKMENQANRAEKLLKGVDDKNRRSWFQNKVERKKEKGNTLFFFFFFFLTYFMYFFTYSFTYLSQLLCDFELINLYTFFPENLRLTEKMVSKSTKQKEREPSVKNKKKKNEPKKDTAEDRAKKELEKIAAYQARLAKRSNKQKKIRAVREESNRAFSGKGITSHCII